MESVQNRKSPLEILFINHERIVFGQKAGNADLQDGMEYALEMSFPLPRPLSERKIFGTCRVESNYYDENRELVCAVCRYTSLQEEDIHTGTNLFQNLLRYKHFQDDKFYAEIHTVNGRDDFFDCFLKCRLWFAGFLFCHNPSPFY